MSASIYYKQVLLLDPDKIDQPSISIYGVGSVGSHVAHNLARLGLTDISVYDMDVIEGGNVPAQMYSFEDVGKKKVEALKGDILRTTGHNIGAYDTEITIDNIKDNVIPSKGSIHIIAIDDMDLSKLIIDFLSDYDVYIIDGRIGGFQYEKYTLNTTHGPSMKYYKSTYDGKFSELQCGEKCLYPVNSRLGSMIASDVINIIKGRDTNLAVTGSILGIEQTKRGA